MKICANRTFYFFRALLGVAAAFLFTRAWAYTQLGPDRVLLMNNDTNIWCQVSHQGYNDIDPSNPTYWVHSKESTGFAGYLKVGRFHTLYRSSDDTALWHLDYCRAGSGTSSATDRNYIAWSDTAESINTSGSYGFTSVSESGTIVFCNTTDAAVYSPCLDGIGAIYFDAVNSITNVSVAFGIDLATNVLSTAEEGVDLVSTNYSQFAWIPCPFDVISHVWGQPINDVNLVVEDAYSFSLSATGGGNKLFYRIRANVYSFLNGYRGPVRFRIVRKDVYGTSIDSNFMVVDNLVASYPPMTAEIQPNGVYDESASGFEVGGYTGAFSPPLLSIGQTNVLAMAHCTYVTNNAEQIDDFAQSFVLSNAYIVGRWRYLNQYIGDWKTNDLVAVGGDLHADVGFDLPDMVGDWEYYFVADQSAPHYVPVDYTLGTADGTAYGSDWTEEITNIVCRASYAKIQPSAGTNWFTRIREGASDYAYVSLVGDVTTNGLWGVSMHELEDADGNVVKQNERVKMELVGDHTWRYHYYIPTNAIGERIRFHFEGLKYGKGDDPFRYTITTNIWYANSTNVPYLPYTMAASGTMADKNEAIVELDGSTTHLQIEFNDELGTFSLARGSYQSFNEWTDANDGYRGHISETTGVADVKTRWDAKIDKWEPTRYARPTLWREAFEITENNSAYPYLESTVPSSSGLKTVDDYDTLSTPNGWNAENSAFVPRARSAPYGYSLQMEGEGKGALMLNNLPASEYIPNGVGEVVFAARVAQVPTFDGFCYDYFNGRMQNYAVSAKVSMSRLYNASFNPNDIAPANPSVSLVGYYQGSRSGCYEFRVTRSGEDRITVALYRWKNEKAELLVENIIPRSGNATLADGQTGMGVGGTINSADSSGAPISNFNNLVLPMSDDDAIYNRWTCMCLSLCTIGNTVFIEGFLSKSRNTSTLYADSANVLRVLAYRDSSPGALLKGGSPGIGSVGCQAGFGTVYTHDFSDTTTRKIDISVANQHASIYADWDYIQETWRPLAGGELGYGAGFTALIPTNQTVRLLLQEPGGKWVPSGWEENIVAFAAKTNTFRPCLSPDSYVRLETGDAEAEVVIDLAEVKSWRAGDTPNLSSQQGHYDEWAYTMSSIESSAKIEGAPYQLEPAGTNAYVFIFSEPGLVTFAPKVEMKIERVLLVGGGGKAIEQDWSSAPATQPTNRTIVITIGASGRFSRITSINGKNTLDTGSGNAAAITSDITGTSASYGGTAGNGKVILRVSSASKLCVLQPTRSYPLDGPEYGNAAYPMGIRSKYMDNGLSLFSFSYRDADTNAVLRLQLCTNIVSRGEVYGLTRESANSANWTTLTNWTFKGLSSRDLAEGTRTYFLSLRPSNLYDAEKNAQYAGMLRLVMDPAVITNAMSQPVETRDLDYGKITITRAFCYDEPELDARSWWGWNLHTEGWGDTGDPGKWAYLTDSPNGLSCSLNFSALKAENAKNLSETHGIGLGEPDKEEQYAENNPFVQCPEMTNGIGSVSFRARTFEPNPTAPSIVILYGAEDVGAYQPDELDGQTWKRLAEFVISNNTYQTYSWRTNELSAAIRAVRLEVGGARHGRKPSDKGSAYKDWERPTSVPSSVYEPIQRVFMDEVTVSEPVGPRLKFFDVRPFRSHLTDSVPKAITNINDRNEQPLLGESWGIQARIEPQQMADELDLDSIVVKMAAYVGTYPWGYQNWKDNPSYEAELTCVDREKLIFRSTYDNPSSVIAPLSSLDVDASFAVVQYHVWAEFRSTDADPANKNVRTYPLSAADWKKPEWYWPKDYNAQYGFGLSDNFSAFTILDSISPGRAWFNEVNYNSFDYDRDSYQFIELMVPEGVDITGWRVKVFNRDSTSGYIVTLGESQKAKNITSKVGTQPGIDSTNHFTVVSIATPQAESSGLFGAGQVDGYWDKVPGFLPDGNLSRSEAYGLELIRPSGVVEHQVTVQGTNLLAFIGGELADRFSGSALAKTLNDADGSGGWFFAGENLDGDYKTLGVWRGHGERLWEGAATWTNDLTSTPGELNLRNGQRQLLDDWMLPPNGTNIWIYAVVNGAHTWQYVDGNPAHTNKNTMMVVRINTTTNIRYKVDAWYELTNCMTNGKPVTPTAVAGQTRTFEISLPNIQEATTVVVGDKGDSRLFGTDKPWKLAEDDPYKPAVLDWLLRTLPDGNPDEIVAAEQWDVAQTRKVGTLDLKAMYWLDIPPTADANHDDVNDWRLLFDIKKAFTAFPTVEDGVTYSHNSIGAIQMLMTNTVDGAFHPPYTIQGMQPGSSSAADFATMSENWTSATFKVSCALNYPGQSDAYRPVKWFVFDDRSFSADGTAWIEVPDQSKTYTPGFDYGWSHYLGTSFYYKAALDGKPSGLYSTEMLRAVHTNDCPPSMISP